MQKQPNKPQSITAFAGRKAKILSLKIFAVGVCSTFVMGLLIGAYYYHGQLFQTLGVVAKSLSQPMALGGDYLPTQIIKTLVKSGNFKDAWIVLPNGNVHVNEHLNPNPFPFDEIKKRGYYWIGGVPYVLASERISYHSNNVGKLYVGYQIPIKTILGFALAICILFSIIALYLYSRILKLAKNVATPFQEYSEELEANPDKEKFLDSDHGPNQFSEILKFNSILLDYIKRSKMSEALARKAISKAQIAKVANRVRHDVMASLVIGESALERIKQDNSQANVLKSVFERISNTVEDIPNIGSLTEDELILAAIGDSALTSDSKDTLRPSHVCAFVYQIVGEIRSLKFSSGKDIQFNVTCESDGFDSFCEVEPNKFKRNLVNLYKNSVEAIDSTGIIDTTVSMKDDFVTIVISDNGKGMSQKTLKQVGKRGVTIGKEDGSGIGLSSAIEDVGRWGGKLKITSTEGKGTTVTIVIPKSEENFLFPTRLVFTNDMTVVLVDDDPLIHKVWKNKFAPFKDSSVQFLYATNLTKAKKFISRMEKQNKEYVLLIDNELRGSSKSGIEFVDRHNLQSKSILVTSNGNSNWVYEKCSKINLPIVPKAIQEPIPVEVY